jgi:preprotein translocase subunit SecA
MDRVRGLMERIGVEDGTPIEAGLLSRIIENAQHKVEGYNFDLRKHTVDFDDVMNKQRLVIYADRRAILDGQEMRDQVVEMIRDEVAAQVEEHIGGEEEDADYAALIRAMRTIDPRFPAEITPDSLRAMDRDELIEMLMGEIEEAYVEREKAIGEEHMRFVERRMMLGAIDSQWIDYLTGMEDLRQEIGLQAIAQRDPLVEYQRNASLMFVELKENIQRDIVYRIVPVSYQYEQHLRQIELEQQQRLAVAQRAGASEEQAKAARTVRKELPKVGRNDPCPCGSGKKFKHCHEGREAELAQQLSGIQAAAAQPSLAQQLATKQGGAAQPQRGRAAPPTQKKS